jgi:hypothetical protein
VRFGKKGKGEAGEWAKGKVETREGESINFVTFVKLINSVRFYRVY